MEHFQDRRRGPGGHIPGIAAYLLAISLCIATAAGAQAQQVSNSVRSGLWSDPKTWDVPPTSSRDVVIHHNVTIDSGQCRQLTIQDGITTLAGDLNAYGSVIVWSTLQGTQGRILFHVANDRLFNGNTKPGPLSYMPDFHPEDIGLWGFGEVYLTGPDVTPWLNALPKASPGTALPNGGSKVPAIGGGTATLAAPPVGWQPGDKLLLTSVEGNVAQAELKSVNGAQITYINPAPSTFVGNAMIVSGRYAYPKVANLSRRLAIIGADVKDGDTNHRAHTAFMCCCASNGEPSHCGRRVVLKNVEFRNLGPRAKLGRYPIHFHHTGNYAGWNGVQGCSIWQSVNEGGNRFISMHDVQGAIVDNNVGFRCQGHGFYMESGPEAQNEVVGNLSADVRGPEELDSTGGTGAMAQTHHYWLRAGNKIESNVAVGAPNATLPPGVIPAPIGMVLMPTTFKTTTPLTAECSFNEFYGCGKYAIWAAGVPDAHFNNILAAFNSSAAWGGMPGWGFDSPRPVLNNPTFLYNGDGDSTYGAQMFLNMDRAVQVNGGLFVGTMAVHTHYETDFVMTGTMIRGKVLMDPTYWEFSGVLNQCDIGVTTLFKTVYPKRRNAAGLLRMKSCVRNSDGVSLTAHTGDYVAASYRDAFGLAGKPISTGGMLLTNPMPASGFLQFPTSVSTYANYVIAPAGRADLLSRWPLWIGFEKQAEWTRLTGTLGYEHGFPPGDYDVKLVSQDCKTVIATKRIKIVSGAVTKF